MTSLHPARTDAGWPACPFEIVPEASAPADPPAGDTLCVFRFGAPPAGDGDPRRVCVPLPQLAGGVAGGECWRSIAPVRSGCDDGLAWTENGGVTVLQLQVPEAALDAGLEDAVADAYRQLISFAIASGYRHPLRVWNYLSAINAGEGDDERYRRFCVGRYRALAATPGFELQLPAASAIGSPAGSGLLLYALCGRAAGLQVENPGQVSAFRYPRVYGRRSPSFSRATLVPWADGAKLLVSGTASIVGHVSVHPGDPAAQLRQSVANVDLLRAEAVRRHLPGCAPAELGLKSATVYLRRPEHLPLVLPLLPELFGPVRPRLLAGDICRRDLLVEVEAVYRLAPDALR